MKYIKRFALVALFFTGYFLGVNSHRGTAEDEKYYAAYKQCIADNRCGMSIDEWIVYYELKHKLEEDK